MKTITFDFTDKRNQQDMVCQVMEANGMTAEEALHSVVNPDIFKRIAETGWGDIALTLWQHDYEDPEWKILDNPIVTVDFSDEELIFLNMVYDVNPMDDVETIIGLFLIFEMERMGRHI